MKNIIYWIEAFALPLLMLSCKEQTTTAYPPIKQTVICELQENRAAIGPLNSFCFVDSTTFATVSGGNSSIQLYDMDGVQKCSIQRQGRGQFEYINPAIIRSCNDKLYVWCNMSLKFVVFDRNGQPLDEYRYSSAIKDFIPFGDYIVIYGTSEGPQQLIHLFDTKTQTVVCESGDVTTEHALLAVNNSTAPFCNTGSELYYMPLDQLSLYTLSLPFSEDAEPCKIRTLDSKSFQVSKLPGAASEMMNADRMKAFEYLQENSYVEACYKIGSRFVVKTIEGSFSVDANGTPRNRDRHCTFYLFDAQNECKKIECSWDSFYQSTLSTSYGNKIYFITNESDENKDHYKLCQIELDEYL